MIAKGEGDVWGAVPERVMLLGVVALAAIVYLPTLTFDFVYDDHWTLLANGFLREPDFASLVTPAGAARHVPDAFRPTLVLFDVATYQLLGLSTVWHHALSVMLHALVCWLLAGWLAALRAPLPLRITAVGFFGVLAIHAEAVAVVSYREDLLAAALGLGALIAAERAADGIGRARVGWAGSACVMLALACGAKMSAAPIVAVFLLGRVLSPWRDPEQCRSRVGVALAAMALALGIGLAMAQTTAVFGTWNPYEPSDPRLMLPRVGMSATLAASAGNHVDLLFQLVAPLTLSPEYVDQPATWSSASTLLSAGAIAGLLVWAIGCAGPWRRPVVALSILGTALLLLPTSGLAAMPNLRADRFAYLPSALACVGLAALALRAGEAWVKRKPDHAAIRKLAPLVAFAVLQGGFAQASANVYRSDTRLWAIALRRAPHSARAHAVQGELLARRASGQERPDDALLAQARAHCAIALLRDDGTALPQLCDARLAAVEADWSRAYRRFAIALDRSFVGRDRVLSALGSVALDRPEGAYADRIEEAIATLSRATREYPYSSEAYAVAGRVFHRLGRVDQARSHYARARSLRPERWDVVLAGLELQVDLGHPSAARLTWDLNDAASRTAVDPDSRKATQRRLLDAERLFGP